MNLGAMMRDPRVEKRLTAVSGTTRFTLERAGLRRGALPDFLVIGAMKAGTTMFYEWLVTHPLVLPAIEKEVHFFDFHFPRSQTWYRSQLPAVRELDALVATEGQRAIAGEASPTYLFHPLAPRRAHVVVPNAKLIVLLRNPISRAYSHYQTGLRHDWEALSFEDAIDREPVRLDGQIEALLMDEQHHRSFPRYRWSYLSMGQYAEQLEAWFRFFPREQFLFIVSEDMDRDADATFRRVYDFLGLPYHELPKLARRVVGHYEPMEPATRERLQDYFRPHNKRLNELIDIDPDWGD
ncbi:MAG: sulfotransferase domain-containing protein [Acidimicrobiales bacterium]